VATTRQLMRGITLYITLQEKSLPAIRTKT